MISKARVRAWARPIIRSTTYNVGLVTRIYILCDDAQCPSCDAFILQLLALSRRYTPYGRNSYFNTLRVVEQSVK